MAERRLSAPIIAPPIVAPIVLLALMLGLMATLSGCSGGERGLLPVSNAPQREQVEPVPPDGVITLKPGDTIYTVANRYGVMPRRIILANNLPPPYDLSAYRQINIPKPRVHRVAAGETLDTISRRYLVRKDDVVRLNGLDEPYTLREGMRIAIPRRMDYALLDGAGQTGITPAIAPPTPPTTERVAIVPSAPGRVVRYTAGAGAFVWPTDGEIIQSYGSVARGVHNDGVNIKAEAGTVVRASRGGEVAFVGAGLKAFGNLVLIKHDEGWITAYAHLGNVSVSEGQRLDQGAVIGSVGATGRVESPQLHFEIRQARNPVNPEEYLS